MNPVRINPMPLTTLASLPVDWPKNLFPEIQRMVQESGRKVVVLDDDPTGTQTVHGISILADWSVELLCEAFENDRSAFYILTNSRSMSLDMARNINAEIGANLVRARSRTNKDFVVVSRSDSTLRGHFPGEVEALSQAVQTEYDGLLLIPFFLEGGRYTLGDAHYVCDQDMLIPAGDTEFAKDAVFGYRSSNMCHWVEEKTEGRISHLEVASISIEDIRRGGPDRVSQKLSGLSNRQVCIVNAASYSDLEVFVSGLLETEAEGWRFMYRSAASFVRVRAGILPRPLLNRSDLRLPESGGGLILVGSYVPTTTRQLEFVRLNGDQIEIEVDVSRLLEDNTRQAEIDLAAERANQGLHAGKNVLIFTSRRLITSTDSLANLEIGQKISEGLVAIVRSLQESPRYIIAKGGITSSDIATLALMVKKAEVMGQILPGVPVWRTGPESRYPGIPYIVFPGNVGSDEALAEIIKLIG